MKMVFAVPLSSAHLLTAFSTPNHARAEVEVFCTQFSYGRSRFSSFRSLLKGFLRDDRKTAIGDSYNFFFRLMAMTVSPMIVILCRRTIVNIGPGVFGIVQYLIKGCTIWSKWIAFFRNVSGSIETFCNVTIAVSVDIHIVDNPDSFGFSLVDDQFLIRTNIVFDDVEAQEQKRKQEQESLKKEHQLQEAILSIKDRYGKNAILKGMNFREGAMTIERNEQVGGHKA